MEDLGQIMELAKALEELEQRELPLVFNPDRPDLEPNEMQQAILSDWTVREKHVVAGNRSGKSQCGARIVAWWFMENHPYMDRPPEWGTGPLTIIVLGQKSEQMDSELWGNKIKRYLPSDGKGTVYKEIRVGMMLQRVENLQNGNKIIFQSHNNPNQARKDVQAHTAHVVWFDEMPLQASLFSEVRTRIITDNGVFLSTFTPLVKNLEIKNVIENCDQRFARKYKMGMLDNPLFAGREDEIRARYANDPPGLLAARLYGDWYMGENAVFTITDEAVEVPHGYSPLWRHEVWVDPASTNKVGLIWAAERPFTDQWYLIKADEFAGEAPSDLVETIEKEIELARINVTKRVCDTASDWFIKEARKAGITYLGPRKSGRYVDMLTGSQQAVYDGRVRFTPEVSDLIEQLTSAQRRPSDPDSIINAKNLHLLHAFIYGVDMLPAPMTPPKRKTFEERLIEADNKRRKAEASAKSRASARLSRRRRPYGRKSTRRVKAWWA